MSPEFGTLRSLAPRLRLSSCRGAAQFTEFAWLQSLRERFSETTPIDGLVDRYQPKRRGYLDQKTQNMENLWLAFRVNRPYQGSNPRAS